MSYDLSFAVRPGKEAPTREAVLAWLQNRPHWIELGGDSPRYENEATGARISFGFHDGEPEEEDRDRAPFYVYVSDLRPHVFGLEVADEVEALVRAFDVLVKDVQDEERPKGEFSRERFLQSWNKYNDWVHQWRLGQSGEDPPPVLPRERLEEVWRWNRGRESVADRLGDDVFVPTVSFFLDGGDVRTYVAWVDGTPARVPQVDRIVTPRRSVAWSDVAQVIAEAPRGDENGPHYIVEGDVLARVFEAIERAPAIEGLPRGVPVADVCTKDIVDRFSVPPEEREKKRRAGDLMSKAQFARYQGKEHDALTMMQDATQLDPRRDYLMELAQVAHKAEAHLVAYDAASRAFALDPQQFAGLLAAANGSYAAKYEESLAIADRLCEVAPNDRNTHILRAVCLTELARYPEAIEASDAALAIEDEPMVTNMKAYALAALGREDEARATYDRALDALDAAIANDPKQADLHSRRAYALIGLGKAKEALAAAKEALRLEKGAFLALQSQGRALVALGKSKEALVALKAAIHSRAAAPMASFYAAQAHLALGDRSAATRALSAARASKHFERLAQNDPKLAKLLDAKAPPPASTKPSPKKKAAPKKAKR